MPVFNTRIKSFPGGGTTYSFYDNGVHLGARNRPSEPNPDKTPSDPRIIELKARKRARGEVYDLARSNVWEWFITLTLSPDRVNRWDYEECAAEVMKFADLLRKSGNQYIIVPEQHKNGAWHFHGLVIGDLKLIPATNYYTGELLTDNKGRVIYNITNYKYGLNTATAVENSEKAASYLAKYMSKEMCIPRGKKRYWASKSLKRPEVEYTDKSIGEQAYLESVCDYQKTIEMKFGRLSICDFREKDSLDPDFIEEGFCEHDDIFSQIDPMFSWTPFDGEQLKI